MRTGLKAQKILLQDVEAVSGSGAVSAGPQTDCPSMHLRTHARPSTSVARRPYNTPTHKRCADRQATKEPLAHDAGHRDARKQVPNSSLHRLV